jgi:flagellar basal body-associated protein FliL
MSVTKPTEATPAPARSSPLVPIALVILILQNAAILALWQPWKHPAPASAAAAAADGHQADAAPEIPRPASVLKLEPFVVNLADVEKRRYARATLQVGLADKKSATEVAEKPELLSPARQAVIDILGARQAAEMVTQEGKEKLRAEIKERLNAIPLPSAVVDVYITDFLIQF